MQLGVVIVTFQRPWHLERCLDALRNSAKPIDEIIVVDSAPNRSAEPIARRHGVRYLTNEAGYGHMTESRNLGWRACASEIVAFIDDDSFVTPQWAEEITSAYDAPSIGGVGGRAITNPAQEPAAVTHNVGTIEADGSLVANFDTPGEAPLEVQHLIGCNMSFRRVALVDLGGFRADYPGTALREETDLCFHLTSRGWTLLYQPSALVIHVGAPHARGQRFDLRYQFYAQRNHTQLLVRNFGWGSTFRSHLRLTARSATTQLTRDLAATFVRPAVGLFATLAGIRAGAAGRRRDRRSESSRWPHPGPSPSDIRARAGR